MCPVGERGALSGGGNWLGLLTGFCRYLSKMALSVRKVPEFGGHFAFWLLVLLFGHRHVLATRHGAICSYYVVVCLRAF